MNNNYLSTIPQVADNLRVKGVQIPKYIDYNFQPLETSNPANKDYRDGWRMEAINSVYNGLKNIQQSKLDLLKESYYPKRNNNTAQMPFQTSQNLPSFSSSMIGRGNITQSSALSDSQYEKYRRDLLKERFNDYQRLKGVVAPPPQASQTNIISDNDRKQINRSFSSLTGKVNTGIADASAYNDLSEIINYFEENIWKYTESVELLNFIRSLEDIQQALNVLYENINSNELDDRAQEEYLQYSVAMYNTIEKLISYIEKALSNVGRGEMERKALSNINEGENKNPLTARSRKSIQKPPPINPDDFADFKSIENLTPQIQQEPEPQFNSDVLNQVAPVNFDVARFAKKISRTFNTFSKIRVPQVIELAKLFGVNYINPDGTIRAKKEIWNDLSSIRASTGFGKSRRNKKRKGGFYYDPFASFNNYVNCQMGLKGFCQ
jgi:hypothetical protein